MPCPACLFFRYEMRKGLILMQAVEDMDEPLFIKAAKILKRRLHPYMIQSGDNNRDTRAIKSSQWIDFHDVYSGVPESLPH